jgi:hypothetical protein
MDDMMWNALVVSVKHAYDAALPDGGSIPPPALVPFSAGQMIGIVWLREVRHEQQADERGRSPWAPRQSRRGARRARCGQRLALLICVVDGSTHDWRAEQEIGALTAAVTAASGAARLVLTLIPAPTSSAGRRQPIVLRLASA